MATAGGDSNAGDNDGNGVGGLGGPDGNGPGGRGNAGEGAGQDVINDKNNNPGFHAQTVSKKDSAQLAAAAAIKKGLRKARRFTRKGERKARGDLQPFTDAGVRQLAEIENLLTPEGQNEFVTKNPFFDALADDAQRRLFNNQAARGKVGSGGTAEALQNSLLLLGNDLVTEDINRRSGITNLGFNAASNQANISSTSSLNLADLAASGGETEAAGILGVANTKRQDSANKRSDTLALVGTGITALAASDRRVKYDIIPLGTNNGTPSYLFKYKGDTQFTVGTMAQDVGHVPNAVFSVHGVKFVNYGAF